MTEEIELDGAKALKQAQDIAKKFGTYIIVLILIAIALLSGLSYGYEKGVNMCSEWYEYKINMSCFCYEPHPFRPVFDIPIGFFDYLN